MKDKLGEIANIYCGVILSRIEDKNENPDSIEMKILTPRAISNGVILDEYVSTIKCLPNAKLFRTNPEENLLTKEGDVVIKMSTPFDACYITKEYENMIVPSFCAILRFRNIEKDTPEILYFFIAFINSNVFKEKLKTFVADTTIQIVNKTQLEGIEIANDIKFEKACEIGRFYMDSIEKRRLMKKIEQLENEYLESTFLELGE